MVLPPSMVMGSNLRNSSKLTSVHNSHLYNQKDLSSLSPFLVCEGYTKFVEHVNRCIHEEQSNKGNNDQLMPSAHLDNDIGCPVWFWEALRPLVCNSVLAKQVEWRAVTHVSRPGLLSLETVALHHPHIYSLSMTAGSHLQDTGKARPACLFPQREQFSCYLFTKTTTSV